MAEKPKGPRCIEVVPNNIKLNTVDQLNVSVIRVIGPGDSDRLVNEVILYGQDGKEAARIVYDRHRGACSTPGAPRVWVETYNKIRTSQKPRG